MVSVPEVNASQETDQRRFGGATPQTSEGQPPAAGPSVAPTSAAPDLGALMVMLQEQARRQEEQVRRLEEQLRGGQDEQARRQEEQARRLEEQMLLMKDLHATFGKEIRG